jgi:hypothetical protein
MSPKYIDYETLDGGRTARITLNRPDARNAQNRGLLVALVPRRSTSFEHKWQADPHDRHC